MQINGVFLFDLKVDILKFRRAIQLVKFKIGGNNQFLFCEIFDEI